MGGALDERPAGQAALEAPEASPAVRQPQPSDEVEEGAGYHEEEEPSIVAARSLCQDLAAAVVLRQALAPDSAAALAAQPAQPAGLCLGLAGGQGAWLLHMPVMQRGCVVWCPADPAHAVLQEGTAAWQSFQRRACLAWRRSSGSPPGFRDWRSLLASNPEARALLTAPLAAGEGASHALGALTWALQEEPAPANVAALRQLADLLAAAVEHHTKSVWEESLGFLQQVIPLPIARRMMSAAVSFGPLAAAPTPAMVAVAAAAAAAEQHPEPATLPGRPLTPARGIKARGPGQRGSLEPATPSSGSSHASLSSDLGVGGPPDEAPLRVHTPKARGIHQARLPALPSIASGTCCAPGRVPAIPSRTRMPRQKWNLEFVDPYLEESFKQWFNTMQTQTDLAVTRCMVLLLLPLVAGLVLRGGTCWGDVLAVSQGLLSVGAMAALLALDSGWYAAHRCTLVAGMRIASAAMLLTHRHIDPGFYSGSLVRALTGSCCLTLVANSLRSRLRFSNHLLVQLAKLYLCATANCFAFAEPRGAQLAYLPLAATSALQLACALLPSLMVYRLESSLRRQFLQNLPAHAVATTYSY